MRSHRWPALFLSVSLSACSGGPTPPPPPPPTYPVNVVVYYDENANGALDAPEIVRIPNATVRVGTASGVTAVLTGRAPLFAVAGTYAVTVDATSLPPFYTAGTANVTVPATSEVLIPVTLPLGRNRPNKGMGFGDSLTSDSGYLEELEYKLQNHFGYSLIVDEGNAGTRSGPPNDPSSGVARIEDAVRYARPAYTLILYGTNDWNHAECKENVDQPCYTINSLRRIVQTVVGYGSFPFLATLPPVNEGRPNAPADRQDWVRRVNEKIRVMAREEGAVLVDVHKAFMAEPRLGDLFFDHVHVNGAGRDIMVREFFNAITQRQAASASQSRIRLGFGL
jgi:lysophospholipase L1-like esterase